MTPVPFSKLINERVTVYWNVHKQVFSIRLRGRVVAHSESLRLKDCVFHVGKAGQAKVRKEKRKNVHAWVRGTFIGTPPFVLPHTLKYNPYLNDTFVVEIAQRDTPVEGAKQVSMHTEEVGGPLVNGRRPILTCYAPNFLESK